MEKETREKKYLSKECPDLLAEWNYEKNADIGDVYKVTLGSQKKVWWKCKQGHEWEDRIVTRVVRKNVCPYCSGKRIIAGVNDLQALYPEIASEWNYEKNKDLLPTEVFSKSGKRVWWKCKYGHEWDARIIDRTNQGGVCPYCSGLKPISGVNDFATLRPDLMKEWNHEKNTDILPDKIHLHSQKKVWWKCEKGHEWETIVGNRVSKKYKCPYCMGVKVLVGFNDLKTLHPDLAKEWNYEKNTAFSPEMVTVKSGRRVWWKCMKGHEWEAVIAHRSNGRGCPICSGQQTLEGYNDLLTKNPILASEWNYEKNGDLLPTAFTEFSTKKVWWKCKICAHEWQATIGNRSVKTGCPMCYKRRRKSLPDKN